MDKQTPMVPSVFVLLSHQSNTFSTQPTPSVTRLPLPHTLSHTHIHTHIHSHTHDIHTSYIMYFLANKLYKRHVIYIITDSTLNITAKIHNIWTHSLSTVGRWV